MATLTSLMTRINVAHLAPNLPRPITVEATAGIGAQIALPAAQAATVEAASERTMPTTWNLIPPITLEWIVEVNTANPQGRFAAAAPTQLALVG